MSGSVAMPHPSIARTLTHSPGCGGRYLPITQETESPKKVTRGSVPEVPTLRPGRSIGTTVPDADGRGGADLMMTGAAVAPAGCTGGVVMSTMATAVAPIADTVTPIGARRG